MKSEISVSSEPAALAAVRGWITWRDQYCQSGVRRSSEIIGFLRIKELIIRSRQIETMKKCLWAILNRNRRIVSWDCLIIITHNAHSFSILYFVYLSLCMNEVYLFDEDVL